MSTTIDLFSPTSSLDEMLNVPEIVFIVPYRNREQHKTFFIKYMTEFILKDVKQRWQIVFVHQCDMRAFNRGAMKNIGFKYLKDTYPKYYKDITIVFNDVDTAPYKPDLIDYNTSRGTVKHFYGFDFALGGIVSMKAGDFEVLNGFPNLWAWGFEDNELQVRWIEQFGKGSIDRSTFFKQDDPNILVIFHGYNKLVSTKQKEEYGDYGMRQRTAQSKYLNGLNTVYCVNYSVKELEQRVLMVDVDRFDTKDKAEKYSYEKIDLSKKSFRIYNKRGRMGMVGK
jgi:hypothetical protein